MVEELKEKFNKLTDEEKMEFMKSVMPAFCATFAKDPGAMMSRMMPMCAEMMNACGKDMQGMTTMMGMMDGFTGAGKR